ncbi:MAG TPA: nuclear transport factor 2 family protein [Terriglobales bacterium]|nr:nuclear transport factor 2 family protein [Terriglobales bacterium]
MFEHALIFPSFKPYGVFVGATFLVLFFAGSVPPSDSQTATSHKASDVRQQLVADEQALVAAEKHHDRSAFSHLLREDLIYVAFNGWVFTKKDIVSKMRYIDVDEYDPANIKVRVPAADTALITYDLKAKTSIAGHDLPKSQYVSSLWVRKNNRWQLLFHQATPATHP